MKVRRGNAIERIMVIALEKLERAKGFEPSTPTLARSCSTPELRPLGVDQIPFQALPIG